MFCKIIFIELKNKMCTVSLSEDKTSKSSVLPAMTTGTPVGPSRMSSSSSAATMEAILQEPDVIASTKNNISKSSESSGTSKVPIAPPRRKKKSKAQTPSEHVVS